MIKNNVTSINSYTSQPTDSVTLAGVQDVLKVWRDNKKTRGEKIPEHLWDQVLRLLKANPGPESKTLAALGLGRPQLEAEQQRRRSIVNADEGRRPSSAGTVEFCDVQRQPAPVPAMPLVHKPAQAFTTHTSVVELYRPDGMLMKIHICTDRFEELLRAFFNGSQR